jgi:DNA-directed RNA polymerase beta subunit
VAGSLSHLAKLICAYIKWESILIWHPDVQLQDQDGIAAVGEMIRPGDIYVNKQSPIDTRNTVIYPNAMPDS